MAFCESRLHPLRCPSVSMAPHSGQTRWAQQAASPLSMIGSSLAAGVGSSMTILLTLRLIFTLLTRTLCIIILYPASWTVQWRWRGKSDRPREVFGRWTLSWAIQNSNTSWPGLSWSKTVLGNELHCSDPLHCLSCGCFSLVCIGQLYSEVPKCRWRILIAEMLSELPDL